MTKTTKAYQLQGMAAAKLMTTWCGVEITLNFRNGMGANGHESAILITSEQFIQDAIEHDSRFGSLIRLDNIYENESRARNEYQQTGAPNVDKHRQQTEAAEAAAKAQAAEEDAKKKAMREKRAKAKAKATENTVSSEAITFTDKNEAMHFLIEKGETVTEETLAKLLVKYNATIEESDK